MNTLLRYMKRVVWVIIGLIIIFLGVITVLTLKEKETPGDVFIPTDGSVYHDEDGQFQKNLWLDANEKRYYVGDDGRLILDRMAGIDGKNYLFAKDGALVTGQNLLLDGKMYKIAPDGTVSLGKGLVEFDGYTCYGDEQGKPVTDQKVKDGGKEYYLNAEGHLVRGEAILYQDKLYVASEQGTLSPGSGWQEVKGVSFFGESDGSVARNKQVKRGNELCYLNGDGQAVTSQFYTFEDRLYYADEKGNTRRQEGWMELDGRSYYSDSEGAFYYGQYVTIDGEKIFFTSGGARVYGKPTIDQYLCCENIYEYMVEHFSDYYFKTPYRSLKYTGDPALLIQPYGMYGEDGGMNCTGFISSLVTYSGGDLGRVSAMGRFGGYGNGDNYLMLATKGVVLYENYKTVKQLLASGEAKKGNIFYLAPVWKSGGDCHMAVFWGETPDENAIWSQTARTLCTVTEIYMVDPINQIFMFPLSRNLERDNTLKPE